MILKIKIGHRHDCLRFSQRVVKAVMPLKNVLGSEVG